MERRTFLSGLILVLALMCAVAPVAEAQDGNQYYVGYHPQNRTYTLVYTSAAHPALINGPAQLVRGGYQQVFGPSSRTACVNYLKSVRAPGW